ncbi:Auxin responsive SAUR protein [Artemisia annua]|uniref:Auxin responsive SAUR protein n=1 Tax=Artemisia annua TaxID=35608 RepID=A0A2U1Q441_ARTAN|nr:Auxin responsive SAUR protein [Artemisia annua]
MGLQNLPRILHAKQGKLRILSPSSATETPKGYFSIYVGESTKKRFLVPLTYLRHPSFQALLNLSQDEFGYAHPMGGLTFACKLKDIGAQAETAARDCSRRSQSVPETTAESPRPQPEVTACARDHSREPETRLASSLVRLVSRLVLAAVWMVCERPDSDMQQEFPRWFESKPKTQDVLPTYSLWLVDHYRLQPQSTLA